MAKSINRIVLKLNLGYRLVAMIQNSFKGLEFLMTKRVMEEKCFLRRLYTEF